MLTFALAIPVTGHITFRTSIVSSQTWIFWVENANARVRFFPLLSRICRDAPWRVSTNGRLCTNGRVSTLRLCAKVLGYGMIRRAMARLYKWTPLYKWARLYTKVMR